MADAESPGLIGQLLTATGVGSLIGVGSMWGGLRSKVKSQGHRIDGQDDLHKATSEALNAIRTDVAKVAVAVARIEGKLNID
ncbi:MAG: hypothetical protein ACPGVG_18455 [Mycobacterium sp.]